MADTGANDTDAPQRPRVAVLYSHASLASREGEQNAKYVGLCMAASGHCEKVFVVGLDPSQKPDNAAKSKNSGDATTKARRSDGLVIEAQKLDLALYEETLAYQVLAKCHVWVLLLDADATATSMQFLQKRCVYRVIAIICSSAADGLVDTYGLTDYATGDRVKKVDSKQHKRIVVSLQTALRQLAQLDHGYAFSYRCGELSVCSMCIQTNRCFCVPL